MPMLPPSVSFTIEQIPSKENEQLAVVKVTVYSETIEISNFGTASAFSANTYDNESILNMAKQRAAELVHLTSTQVAPTVATTSIPISPSHQTSSSSFYKEKNNGGGSKPASEKQRDMIAGQCRKRGIEPNELCHTVCNRPLHELQGQDAHAIIQHLKNN